MLVGDGERDRAGAGADVEHRGRFAPGEQREHTLDHDLGLGPRDQRARVDRQRQPTEAPLAEDVLQRLAPRAAVDEPRPTLELGRRQRPVEPM